MRITVACNRLRVRWLYLHRPDGRADYSVPSARKKLALLAVKFPPAGFFKEFFKLGSRISAALFLNGSMVIPMRLEWWIILTGEDNDEERVRFYDAWRNEGGILSRIWAIAESISKSDWHFRRTAFAEIVNNRRRRITADTALRLSLYFGNSPEFWMNLQSHYDVKMARSDLKAVKS